MTTPGTYWKKFLARNPNYQGRTVKVWEGWQGLSRSGFQLRWQGTLDNITYDKDQVILDCVDPLKSIASYTLPHKIEVSLAGDITAGSTELAVRLSSRLSTYSYFRISDEVMQINSYNSAIDSVDVTRAVLNTVAEENRAGAKMQPIWHRGPENPFDTMLFISSFCDMSVSIDATAFAAAKDWPGDDKDIETYINEPVNCDKLLFELADLTNTRIWYDEHQRITCKRISANDPNRTYINISDHANIIEDSASVNYRALERISRYWMYWGLSPIGEEDKSTSYSYLTGAIDADAESSFCYDKIIEETIYNRWSHSTEGPGHTDAIMRAKTYVQRMLFNRRDPLPMINIKVELKDSTIMTGDYVRIDTDEIEEITGVHTNNKYIVTFRDVIGDGIISLKAQALPTRNIAIIAPATLTADWSAASPDDRVYAYICDSSGVMTDGETAGYHIY